MVVCLMELSGNGCILPLETCDEVEELVRLELTAKDRVVRLRRDRILIFLEAASFLQAKKTLDSLRDTLIRRIDRLCVNCGFAQVRGEDYAGASNDASQMLSLANRRGSNHTVGMTYAF